MVFSTKFSDLNSYFQALQTRVAVTVAIAALLANAVAANQEFLLRYPPGGRPLLLYVLPFLAVGMAALCGGCPCSSW